MAHFIHKFTTTVISVIPVVCHWWGVFFDGVSLVAYTPGNHFEDSKDVEEVCTVARTRLTVVHSFEV